MTKKRREQLDEAFDELDELMQRWDQRLTHDNLDLAKRYLKDELGVHVKLSYRFIAESGRDSADFCAIFQREHRGRHYDADGFFRHVRHREAADAGMASES